VPDSNQPAGILADLRVIDTHRQSPTIRQAPVPLGSYHTFKELVAVDPVFSTMLTDIAQTGVGANSIARARVELGLFKPIPGSPTPRLGKNTSRVCRELLRLSDAQIEELRQNGIIGNVQ